MSTTLGGVLEELSRVNHSRQDGKGTEEEVAKLLNDLGCEVSQNVLVYDKEDRSKNVAELDIVAIKDGKVLVVEVKLQAPDLVEGLESRKQKLSGVSGATHWAVPKNAFEADKKAQEEERKGKIAELLKRLKSAPKEEKAAIQQEKAKIQKEGEDTTPLLEVHNILHEVDLTGATILGISPEGGDVLVPSTIISDLRIALQPKDVRGHKVLLSTGETGPSDAALAANIETLQGLLTAEGIEIPQQGELSLEELRATLHIALLKARNPDTVLPEGSSLAEQEALLKAADDARKEAEAQAAGPKKGGKKKGFTPPPLWKKVHSTLLGVAAWLGREVPEARKEESEDNVAALAALEVLAPSQEELLVAKGLTRSSIALDGMQVWELAPRAEQ